MDKSKKMEANTEMCSQRFLLKVEQHSSHVETVPSNQGVLAENAQKYTPRKRSLRSEIDGSSAQEAEVINLDDLEVVSP